MLDPMCGLGTILLEAAKEWPVSITLATGRTFARWLVVASKKICTTVIPKSITGKLEPNWSF